MNDRLRTVSAMMLLAICVPASAQDAPPDAVHETSPNMLPQSGPVGSPAAQVRRMGVQAGPPAYRYDPAQSNVMQGETAAATRGPGMAAPPNMSAPATYRPHEATSAASAATGRRDLGVGDSPTPHGRKVSDVRDAADRAQVRDGTRQEAQGYRDIQRGRLMIEQAERPGHDRRAAAEGAALMRQGASEIHRGAQQFRAGSRDLHRDQIAAHRQGFVPSYSQRAEARRAYRESVHPARPAVNWQHGQAVRAQKSRERRGLE